MILVTGADGIVGRAVCSALGATHEEFLPLVHRRQAPTAGNAFVADLTRQGSLDALLHRGIKAIVHLAAAVPHSAQYLDTDQSAGLTRRIDRNVYTFQSRMDIPVLYMSTCGLYDRLLQVVKHEDDASQIRIESPYFSAKLDGERLFAGDQKTTILRLAAPVGQGQKPNVVLSRFIMTARANRVIQIWGSGSREQNFIDVRDVADLILKVLADPKPCIINVAGESPITMIQLARVVIDVVGAGTFELSSKADPREGETARYSISKARDLYGWSPSYDLRTSCGLLVKEDFERNI